MYTVHTRHWASNISKAQTTSPIVNSQLLSFNKNSLGFWISKYLAKDKKRYSMMYRRHEEEEKDDPSSMEEKKSHERGREVIETTNNGGR